MRGFAGFWGLAEHDSSDLSLTSSMSLAKGQSMQSEEKDWIESSLDILCDIKETTSGPCPSKLECSHPWLLYRKKIACKIKTLPDSSINYLTVKLFWTLSYFNANNPTLSTVYVQSKVDLPVVFPKAKRSCQVTAATTDSPWVIPLCKWWLGGN